MVGHLLVPEPRRHHHSLHAHIVEHGEQLVVLLRPVAAVQRGVGTHPVTGPLELLDGLYRHVVNALALHGDVVGLPQAVEVDDEGEVGRGLDSLHRLLVQESVGAQVDEPLLPDDPRRDVADVGVHERLSPSDGDHGRIALLHGPQALFHRQPAVQDRLVFPDAAAATAGEVAGLQRLQDHRQGEVLAAPQPLFKQVPSELQGEPQRLTRHDKSFLGGQ